MRWKLWANTFREWFKVRSLLSRWSLPNVRKPQDREHGWVIALATSSSGTPYKYLRYCPYEVWRWTTKQSMAEVFPSRKTAEYSATMCSVYYQSAYRIMEIGKQ